MFRCLESLVFKILSWRIASATTSLESLNGLDIISHFVHIWKLPAVIIFKNPDKMLGIINSI